MQPIPHWGLAKESLTWRDCSLGRMLEDDCGRTMTVQDALVNGLAAHAAMQQSVADETGAAVIEVTSYVCPSGVCESVTDEGLVRYRDGTHITVPQSEALSSVVTAELSRYSTRP